MRQLPLRVRLRDRALFESFLAGPNDVALTQIKALAEQQRPGLVWLCGPEGSGKTHLLQALCARVGSAAAYVPLSQLECLRCRRRSVTGRARAGCAWTTSQPTIGNGSNGSARCLRSTATAKSGAPAC